ncbi:hypothetical protein KBG31_01995 [Patescibacteria group bacterium]|nr:hypothetical protein [Patescibacteria group bacterium]
MFTFIKASNLLFALSFGLIPVLAIFPFHKIATKMFEVKISQFLLVLAFPALLAFFAILRFRFVGIALFLLALFNSWALLFAFNVDRKYVYILALIFLSMTPLFLLLKMDKIAEYMAVLCYLALVLGVSKDILYEKIFTK